MKVTRADRGDIFQPTWHSALIVLMAAPTRDGSAGLERGGVLSSGSDCGRSSDPMWDIATAIAVVSPTCDASISRERDIESFASGDGGDASKYAWAVPESPAGFLRRHFFSDRWDGAFSVPAPSPKRHGSVSFERDTMIFALANRDHSVETLGDRAVATTTIRFPPTHDRAVSLERDCLLDACNDRLDDAKAAGHIALAIGVVSPGHDV